MSKTTQSKPIQLYQYPTCPYCALVRQSLDRLGIDYQVFNVSRDPHDPVRRDVIENSGTRTVPVIYDPDHDVWMGESADIVAYLERRVERSLAS